VYNPETEREHILNVIIPKNCNGPRCEVDLYYNESDSSIRDIERIDSQDLKK